MSTAAIVAGTAAAGIGGAAISSHAAGSAASDQSQAAEQAAQLQYQASQNALQFQEQEYNQGQQNLQPWLQSGTGALSNLDYLLGVGPQSPGSFNGQPSQYGGGQPGNPTTGTSFPGGTSPSGSNFNPGSIIQSNGGMPQQQAYGVGANPNQSGARVATPGAGTSRMATDAPMPSVPGSTPAINPSGAAPASGAMPSGSTGGGYGSLLQPYGQTFSAPTAQQMEQNDPGYQARLQLGTDAIQRSAAAAGGVVTGGTAQALNQFGQDYASNEYNNYYNQAYNTYSSNYNQYQQQQANTYNRLASLAGVGQTAAGQLGTLGQNAASGVSNNLLSSAAQQGQDYQNAAAANASGVVGSANAWSGALGGGASNLSQLALLSQLYGGGGDSGLTSADVQGGGSEYF